VHSAFQETHVKLSKHSPERPFFKLEIKRNTLPPSQWTKEEKHHNPVDNILPIFFFGFYKTIFMPVPSGKLKVGNSFLTPP
jgi:hypothetical protein